MRTLNNIGILFVIAALALVPQALALQFSFGGSAGSTGGVISPGVYYGEHSVLGGELFESEGLYGTGIDFTDSIDKWWRFHSTGDGSKENVYMYAKLTGDGTFTVSGTQGATSATGKLSVTATTPVSDISLGGSAENPTMYAAVNVNAASADTLKYTNTLSASKTKVSASQTFDGTEVSDFEAGAWAVNGLFETKISPAVDPSATVFAEINPSLAAGQFTEISGIASAITGYKSAASVDAKTATSSQSATSITGADDAEFFGFSWQSVLDEYESPVFNGAKTAAYVGGSSSMAYSASSKATSTGTATATQTLSAVNADEFGANTWAASGEVGSWTLENVVHSDDMIYWDDVDMAAAQFANVYGDGDVFNVKSYTATASVAASGASSSQSANLPTSAGNSYDATFRGSAIDWDEETAVEAQAGAAIDDGRNLVYNSNNKVTSKGVASAGQTFSATDAESIETTGIVSSRNEDGSIIGAAQIADVMASEDDDSFGVKSFTGSASFDGKVAKASQSFTAATGSDDVDATFAGGAINVVDEDNFAGAATASLVDGGQSVAYSAASSSDASASQTLTTKEADGIVQVALAFTQTEDNFDYAGSIVGAGAVYPIISPEEPTDDNLPVGGILGSESTSAVTSYSATDSVSSKTDKSGKITTTAKNTLDAKGGFIGRAIVAGESSALSYDGPSLPLTLNDKVETDDLKTFTENIILVANPDADGVGVVGETLVFAPILSNDDEGDVVVLDRDSDKLNKNSLKGTATATVTNNGVSTTSTLSGSWKVTAQKDTTDLDDLAYDENSVERFAYASNGDYHKDIFAKQGTDTTNGAATFSYTEKAKETVTAYPTASV